MTFGDSVAVVTKVSTYCKVASLLIIFWLIVDSPSSNSLTSVAPELKWMK